MAEGHCNCNSIKVSIPALPDQCALCFCSNCRRAGGGSFSACYLLDRTEVNIQDPSNVLKSYKDTNVKSGNDLTRQFCGNCGSPVCSLIMDTSKVILKGGLFDHVPPPAFESFEEDKPTWMKIAKPVSEDKKA